MELVLFSLLLNLKMLILKEMVWIECVRVRIIYFILTHILLFQLHVLHCAFGCITNICIGMETQ